MTNAPQVAPLVSFSELLTLYDAKYPDDTVDWSMNGARISSAKVILRGAYAPFMGRLLERVAREPVTPITRERLIELAAEVFPLAEDRDFSGRVMTEYKVVLEPEYGFGKAVLGLAQLVPEHVATRRDNNER